MNIIMLSSEVFPFAKAGGLGDVVSQLSEALSQTGQEVKILMPRYGSIDKSSLNQIDANLTIEIMEESYNTELYHTSMEGGSDLYFLDLPAFFERSGIYVSEEGQDYPDNLLRFAVLSKALFAFCRYLKGTMDWQPDIIHAHDWPTALAMTWLRELRERRDEELSETRGVFTIHNIGYQGIFDYAQFSLLGFSHELCQCLGLEYHEKICLLHSAIACADSITTVSPNYAKEILSEEFGFGMQQLLNERIQRLSGILNGIDYELWNPVSDALIPYSYSHKNIKDKAGNKTHIQRKLGLELSSRPALIGLVSRLVTQKGFRLLLGDEGHNLRKICSELDIQMVILGTGEPWIEDGLRTLAKTLANLRVIIDYDETMSHQVQAASDFFLVPSLYEPCGLTQIYALRYGSLPIVSQTGGLLDTVIDLDTDPENGTGLFIDETLSEETIFMAIKRATELWQDRQRYNNAQELAMQQRFTWAQAAEEYTKIYEVSLQRVT